ncbi:unnamed protein product [Owenia fusiformis]|uniref:ELMO domain-containing protein n=1 Tax=Owenia fusiformis TaxID=6347 RepID=A0A8S4NT55_OWEFU|nr:unnamed protein product [Owenia fusiformis]
MLWRSLDSNIMLLCYLEKDARERELQQAQDEWDAVETIVPGTGGNGGTVPHSQPLILYNEALQFFQTADLSKYKKGIRTEIERSGLAKIKFMLFGPPKLNKALNNERDLVFAMAACALDNNEATHLRILQTMYRKLTGSKFDCARFGDHWETIGFQGTDPSTDLRGTGLLGLMTILYCLSDSKMQPIMKDIYKLSLHETQNFPFSVMGINVTRIVLQSLREGILNKECNRRQQVLEVVNDLYAGTYLYLYQIWKSQHKTIADSGFVIKDVEAFVKKNPLRIMKNLEIYIEERRNIPSQDSTNVAHGNKNLKTEELVFKDVCAT